MAPLIEVSNEVLKGLNQLKIPYNLKNKNNSQTKDLSDSIHVLSINLYVAKERTHLGKNWYESHKLLQEQGNRMLIIPEFIEFLKHLKNSNNQENLDIYNEITQVKNSWRAEWLDADFKVKDKRLYINCNHILDSKGNLIPKNSEVFDENTLIENKTPGIPLEDYLNSNHTAQGLPNKDIKSGDSYYWCPRSDNTSVALFGAYDYGVSLNCGRNPSFTLSDLGVRAVKKK